MVTLEGHIRIHYTSLDFFPLILQDQVLQLVQISSPTHHTTLTSNPRNFTGAGYRGDGFRKLQTFKGTAVREARPSPSGPLTINGGAPVAGGKKANKSKQNHIETQA